MGEEERAFGIKNVQWGGQKKMALCPFYLDLVDQTKSFFNRSLPLYHRDTNSTKKPDKANLALVLEATFRFPQ